MSSAPASSLPCRALLQVAVVIACANFAVLFVYNAAWKTSYHIVAFDGGGGGGGDPRPLPLPMFLSNVSQPDAGGGPRMVATPRPPPANNEPRMSTYAPRIEQEFDPDKKVDVAAFDATM